MINTDYKLQLKLNVVLIMRIEANFVEVVLRLDIIIIIEHSITRKIDFTMFKC